MKISEQREISNDRFQEKKSLLEIEVIHFFQSNDTLSAFLMRILK